MSSPTPSTVIDEIETCIKTSPVNISVKTGSTQCGSWLDVDEENIIVMPKSSSPPLPILDLCSQESGEDKTESSVAADPTSVTTQVSFT